MMNNAASAGCACGLLPSCISMTISGVNASQVCLLADLRQQTGTRSHPISKAVIRSQKLRQLIIFSCHTSSYAIA